MLCLRYYALLAPRPSYEIKTPNDAVNNIGQRETPFIKRKGEHLPFRPVFDYFTAWKLHRRKGLQINVGKISLVFVVVLCSAYTRHLCPCCVWTNEESLAAAFRNSRKNRQKKRQNTGQPRPQGLLLPIWFLNVRIDLSDLFAYADFFTRKLQ